MKLTREDWVIGGVIGYLAFGRKFVASRNVKPRRVVAPAPVPVAVPVKAAPPPLKARIYQNPDDSFDTVRMSVDFDRDGTFKEMGIFSSRAIAEKQARDSGWVIEQ